jgi:hypothetical protein
MIWHVIWFLIGLVIGSLGMWVYGEVTDKVKLAKTGYGLGKTFILWILGRVKK